MPLTLKHWFPGKVRGTAALLRVRRCLLACALLAGSGVGAVHAQSPAQNPAALERQVKAAYLYKFASFVEWPEGSFTRPDSPLQIGVAGSAALAEQLEQMIAGRSVNGHPVRVKRLQAGEPLAELHILFLDSSLEHGALAAIFGAARGQSLLTVSDAADALAMGCMIRFVVAEDKLRFDVALRSVNASHLRISARMLAVAHHVQAAT